LLTIKPDANLLIVRFRPMASGASQLGNAVPHQKKKKKFKRLRTQRDGNDLIRSELLISIESLEVEHSNPTHHPHPATLPLE
jgi:hypothetical protein